MVCSYWRCLIHSVAQLPSLNGDSYLNFIQNIVPDLLENVPLETSSQMVYMHDGGHPHYTNPVSKLFQIKVSQ